MGAGKQDRQFQLFQEVNRKAGAMQHFDIYRVFSWGIII